MPPAIANLIHIAGCHTVLLCLVLSTHAKQPTVARQPSIADQNQQPDKLTWENMERRVGQSFARNGLDGALLVSRDGEIVLNTGYGKANREKSIDNTAKTIFAIGSCPIDFTHAAVLLLYDRGKLDLDHPITHYFDQVPKDKQAMTVRHLMTGASGLPNFHDQPTDEDPNHTFIDRDEAVRRILSQQLLFEPGRGQSPSHSAWGLLAAIVEIQSGQTYPEFTREHLFEPAGMKDTGFNGDALPEDRTAVGYGFRDSAKPNSPRHWGKTSWLVMGSGGQVSTLSDIYRWEVAMHDGKLLSDESTNLYLANARGISRDGNMYGFEFYHSHNPESLFMLISNSISSPEKRRAFDEMGMELEALINPLPPFSLGVTNAEVRPEGVTVLEIEPGSAAEEGGLKLGDVLICVGEIPLGLNAETVLRECLMQGKVIRFKIRRDNEEMELLVTPKPRDD